MQRILLEKFLAQEIISEGGLDFSPVPEDANLFWVVALCTGRQGRTGTLPRHIGSDKLPEIKTLFDVSHNSVYFLGAYRFLYAKWSSSGQHHTGLEDGQPTHNKLNYER